MLAATGASAYETSAVITGEKVLNSHNERVSCDWLHLHTHTHTHTVTYTFTHTITKCHLHDLRTKYIEEKVSLHVWLLCGVQHSVIMADMPETHQPIIVIIFII